MYSTFTSPDFTPSKNDFDGLFLWTAIVVLLIMGPLEVLIAYTALNPVMYGQMFTPSQPQHQVHKPIIYEDGSIPTLRI